MMVMEVSFGDSLFPTESVPRCANQCHFFLPVLLYKTEPKVYHSKLLISRQISYLLKPFLEWLFFKVLKLMVGAHLRLSSVSSALRKPICGSPTDSGASWRWTSACTPLPQLTRPRNSRTTSWSSCRRHGCGGWSVPLLQGQNCNRNKQTMIGWSLRSNTKGFTHVRSSLCWRVF